MTAKHSQQPIPDLDYRHLLDQLQLRTAANRYNESQRRMLQQAQAKIMRQSKPES
jgi:hypothetical protein